MLSEYILLSGFLLTAMFLSIYFEKLTISASITGGIIAFIIYFACGYYSLIFMGTFFILGSAATSWKIRTKQKSGLAEAFKGKRNAGQVLANAGTAGLLGAIAYCYPSLKSTISIMIACAFSSATADTLSSELGNIYGSKYYNIFTLKEDIRGSNGVISIQGTLAGMTGSLIIAALYIMEPMWTFKDILIIIIAGTLGNFTDSMLGATLERRKILSNNEVNFMNTVAGSISGLLLYTIL